MRSMGVIEVSMTLEGEQRRLNAILDSLNKERNKSEHVRLAIQGLELSLESLKKARKILKDGSDK